MFTNSILNFTLGTQIGNGGEATVFLATDHQLNAEIVIKKIPQTNFTDKNLFFEESKKIYLTNHHNIVKIMYGSQDADFVYLAMPYYPKGSLKSIIDGRYLTSREIIRYSLQFLSGLNNIHSKGLMHFDVKLENILVDHSDKALISDFGLAEYMGVYGFATVNGTTPVYAPPELFNQADHNLKFDIYQSGIAIYRMCSGDIEFLNQMNNAFLSRGVHNNDNFINNIKREKFPDRSSYLPHIPKPLRNVIKKCLKANPAERYDSVIDILNDLSKIDIATDWQYVKIDTNYEQWTKPNCIVTCNYVNNKFSIQSLKNNRRKTVYCKTLDSKNEAYNLLYTCLHDPNWNDS
ncbi:serine/threonine protein kinase [Chryseobacterium gleum]|uniref:serine/threonine-protein kinase n=1 Tax=Chryseobacterium gleum TaxID=250 RepID=UPI001E5727C0|nr:serine/threonine-protein kinase [Chryseobacterium gleum]MCE4064371.1 serine/threonine protein kinase [Chryseobacterium gleum]